jgi:hypothetical protein
VARAFLQQVADVPISYFLQAHPITRMRKRPSTAKIDGEPRCMIDCRSADSINVRMYTYLGDRMQGMFLAGVETLPVLDGSRGGMSY